MPIFKRCCVCNLELPISIMQPIRVRHQGRIIIVGICNRCKQIKEMEANKNNDKSTS